MCVALAATLLTLAGACGRWSHSPPQPIDLIRLLPTADRRAAGAPDAAVTPDLVDVDGETRPALVMTAPSRVIFSIRFPDAAVFRSRVALLAGNGAGEQGVLARVGISDGRSFDDLLRVRLQPPRGATAPQWEAVSVDLGTYSGWKLSLFYQPSRITWKLILNADPQPGGKMAWVEPVIDGS